MDEQTNETEQSLFRTIPVPDIIMPRAKSAVQEEQRDGVRRAMYIFNRSQPWLVRKPKATPIEGGSVIVGDVLEAHKDGS